MLGMDSCYSLPFLLPRGLALCLFSFFFLGFPFRYNLGFCSFSLGWVVQRPLAGFQMEMSENHTKSIGFARPPQKAVLKMQMLRITPGHTSADHPAIFIPTPPRPGSVQIQRHPRTHTQSCYPNDFTDPDCHLLGKRRQRRRRKRRFFFLGSHLKHVAKHEILFEKRRATFCRHLEFHPYHTFNHKY